MIEELRSEGTIDSRGRFTLDARRAGQKLARYRLVDANAYILHLAASGVAAGATRLSFTSTKAGLQFEHDGHSPDFDQLTLLLEILAHSPPPPIAERELAIAVQALRELDLRWIRLTCPSGQLELTRRQLAVTPGEVSSNFVLSIATGGIGASLQHLLKTDRAELRLLNEHFLYCPIPLEGPQGLINRPWPYAGPAWSAAGIPWPLHKQDVEARERNPWAWAVALHNQRSESSPNLEIVLHGRSYPKREERLPGTALVYSDTLSTDLSGDKIIEEALYAEMLESLNFRVGL